MIKVTIDLEKIKHPNSGLGQFCIHLGLAIYKLTDNDFLGVYLPKSNFNMFSTAKKTEWKSYHKLTGVKIKTEVWHSFHQEAVYFPKDKLVKKVLTIHDLNFLDKYKGKKREKMLNRLQLIVNQSLAVTFISNYTKTVATNNLSIPTSIISKVIYNGVALSENRDSKKPKWVSNKNPFLFTLGIVGEKKNFHVLIEMMCHLPELDLYICGNKETSYAKEISRLIIKYNLSHRIFLTGEITENEKTWMYKNSSAFVFPSKNEGFGLPVVEAMSFGKPLILSNLTSLPEIGGELAAYFTSFKPLEMANVVKETINKHSLSSSINLIERSKLFNWENAAKEYLNLYNEVLKDN